MEQIGHENCVGPMRIWEAVGIQYWPLFNLSKLMTTPSLIFSSVIAVTSADDESLIESKSWSELLLRLGSPMCSVTVTVSSPSSLVLFILSYSLELLTKGSCRSSSCLQAGPTQSISGSAPFRGGEGEGGGGRQFWLWKIDLLLMMLGE